MEILLFDLDGCPIKHYYQWDSGQSIVLNNIEIDDDMYVHFCNPDSVEALVVQPYETNGVWAASVPNQLLRHAKPLVVYICKSGNSNCNNTIYSSRITVIPRAKPSTYIYEETEIIRYESIDARIKAIECAVLYLDTTLTESGKAADAAAVGEALAAIEYTDATDDGTGVITLGRTVQTGTPAEGSGRKVVHVNDDQSITIEVDGVMHDFDWQLITDIFDNNEDALLVDHIPGVSIGLEVIDNILCYPMYRTSNKAYFISPTALRCRESYRVIIESSGKMTQSSFELALAADVPSLAEDFKFTSENQTKVPSAYMVAQELNKLCPKIVDFYWTTDIETYSGELVNGYLSDWEEASFLEYLNRGIPVIGWFYDENEDFLFAEPAVLQSGRYTGNSDAELEINFVGPCFSHAVGNDQAICSYNDGVIVWEI